MANQDYIPLISGAVGAGAALAGVVLKSWFDRRAERQKVDREGATIFLPERKEAYDRFLVLHRQQVQRANMLRKYLLIVRDGGAEPTADELASHPPPVMEEIGNALDTVRRLARSYAVVRAAESMVRLYGDLTAFQRKTLNAAFADGSRRRLTKDAVECDDISWFVLTNLLRDRELEFVHAYRQELGIGSPAGGPTRFPMEERITPDVWPFSEPWSNDFAERIMRKHVLPHHHLETEPPERANGQVVPADEDPGEKADQSG